MYSHRQFDAAFSVSKLLQTRVTSSILKIPQQPLKEVILKLMIKQ